MINLEHQFLVPPSSFIDGAFRPPSPTDTHFTITNPATNTTIHTLPEATDACIALALTSSTAAFSKWRHSPFEHRNHLLRRWRAAILEHTDDLAHLLTLETGKPLAEARGEIQFALSFLDWNSSTASRAISTHAAHPTPGTTTMVTKQPVGVCFLITSWNFPVAMLTRKVAMALAAGCAVVAKPSDLAPLTSLALAYLAHRAGAPQGLFNVLASTRAPHVAALVMSSRAVRLVSFTGSPQVGKLIAASAAKRVLRVLLELGGHAPFIVYDDADVDAAVAALVGNKFRHAGQACIAANRVFVQRGVHDRFCERVQEKVERIVVGDGSEDGVEMGPLINAAAVQRVELHVADAVEQGARLVAGGMVLQKGKGGNFFAPTLLVDVRDEMLLAREETFGPVVGVLGFDDEDEVLERANSNTESGLAAFVFTKDGGRALRAARELDYGMVGVNSVDISGAATPFGGMKESGLGREGGANVLDAFCEEKYSLLRL